MSSEVISFASGEQLISILAARPSPKPGAVVAYVDVKIGIVTVYGLAVVRNKNGRGHFVGLPVRFGKGKHFPLVDVDEPLRADLFRRVLDAAREYTDLGE